MKQKTMKWKIIIIEPKFEKKKYLYWKYRKKYGKKISETPICESSVKNLENVKHELYKRTFKSVVRSFKLAVGDMKSRRQNRF